MLLELDIERVAHGGHCVARVGADSGAVSAQVGRVVFVRHTLPGERVLARLTDEGRLWRADAVEILDNVSPDRVPSAWPAAGPDGVGAGRGVGGGELAHVCLPGQLRWKAAVVAEQLRRLAGIDIAVTVESAGGEPSGLSYRTRIDLIADDDGRAGMRKFRSHEVVALADVPLATAVIADLAARERVFERTWAPGARMRLVAPSASEPVLVVDEAAGADPRGQPGARGAGQAKGQPVVEELVGQHRYWVPAGGFWQVHQQGPPLLVDAVRAAVGDPGGAQVWDMYAGAGLFTLPLADAVGPRGRVIAVEGDAEAARAARDNARHLPQVSVRQGPVNAVLTNAPRRSNRFDTSAVVLDPPRAGAGRSVVASICDLGPDRVVYVACDPAALARDVAFFADRGYELSALRAFDLFPMTHHVECVATLVPGSGANL